MARAVLTPGQVLGIMGFNADSLAMVNAAHELGLKVYAYVDTPQPELTRQADFTIVGNYRAKEKLKTFGEACDVVIYTTPNIDAIVFHYLSQLTQVPQGIDGLEIMQDRLMERAFFDQLNVNSAPYVTVISLEDIYQSIDSIGYPAVLKPIQRGMGAETMLIRKESDIARAANFMVAGTYLLESWIDHAHEYLLTVAAQGDQVVTYPVAGVEYTPDRQLLGVKAPLNVAQDLAGEMARIAQAAVKQLGYQGILTVEFYENASGSLYVKGLAPGLLTAGNVYETAASVSLAAQQVRLAAGLPAHVVTPAQSTLMMVVRGDQLAAVQRQLPLKDYWSYRFFNLNQTQAEQIVGLIWLSGTDLSLRELTEKMEATAIWDPTPMAEPE